MAVTTKLYPRFLEAKNEQELQDKFMRLQISTHKVYKILSIYTKGSKVYLWYYDNINLEQAMES